MADDTTTMRMQENEDKTLVLNGAERLKYFRQYSQPVHKPLARRLNLWSFLRSLIQ